MIVQYILQINLKGHVYPRNVQLTLEVLTTLVLHALSIASNTFIGHCSHWFMLFDFHTFMGSPH